MEQIMPVVISYNSYPWIKVAVKSFRKHFPLSPLLIVDNNPDEDSEKIKEERSWITDWRDKDQRSVVIKTLAKDKRHGLSMDFAASWCRSRSIRWMLHFEPDCLISGITWVQKLIEPLGRDPSPWMVGSHRKSYGPIHPTPSIWDVVQCRSSFESQQRGNDFNHPMFPHVFNMGVLRGEVGESGWPYWGYYWDTAQKPWFDAAKEGRAVLVEDSKDFSHYWRGSTHNRDPRACKDDMVLEYL